MKIYKVPFTFEVFVTEKELANLENEAKDKLAKLIEIDGAEQVMDLGILGEPTELSTKEDKEFMQAASDAYKTQLMSIANGFTNDPDVTAEEAQQILRRIF